MAGETTLTLVGNVTADPELHFTPNGVAWTSFTVASTTRVLDLQSGQWKDGDVMFLRCSAGRDLAEHVTESLAKGTRVIVTGRLKQRSFETKEGEKRTVFELDVDEIGPSLRYATAKVTRVTRGTAPDAAPGAGPRSAPTPPDGDPWSVPAGAGPALSEPPF